MRERTSIEDQRFKIKILHISNNLRFGAGVSKIILDILRHSSDSHIFSCLYTGTSGIDSEISEYDFHHIPARSEIIGKLNNISTALSLLIQMKKQGFTVLHAHDRSADYVLALGKILGYRTIRTHHILYENSFESSSALKEALRLIKSWLLQRHWWVDQWVAVSQSVSQVIKIRWNIPSDRIKVIYNGVDIDKYSPPIDSERKEIRSSMGWEDNDIVCIAIGSLVKHKRHSDLVKVFSLLQDGSSRARLVIVGEGSQRNSLESLICDLRLHSQCTLLGLRDDVDKLLKGSDIFIHGAWGEAFGIVLCEAMSTGLPVVAIDSQGPSEIVEHGCTGELVVGHSDVVFAQKVLALCNDSPRRNKYSANARKAVLRRFSVSNMCHEYSVIYSGSSL